MTISLRLPDDLSERLTHLSKETHRSKTFYLRQALEDFLDENEEYYLALAVKERIAAGTEKLYTLEEVQEKLGLKDE